MQYSLVVPRFFNDGKPIPQHVLSGIEESLLSVFGGFSRVAVDGVWRSDTGEVFTDNNYRYDMLSDDEHSAYMDSIASLVRVECKQESVLWFVCEAESHFVSR